MIYHASACSMGLFFIIVYSCLFRTLGFGAKFFNEVCVLGGNVEASLIQQGVDLMLYGMGTVFAFLTALVVSTSLMSAVLNRYFAELPPAEGELKTAAASANGAAVDPKVLAVIQEAVYLHRAKTK